MQEQRRAAGGDALRGSHRQADVRAVGGRGVLVLASVLLVVLVFCVCAGVGVGVGVGVSVIFGDGGGDGGDDGIGVGVGVCRKSFCLFTAIIVSITCFVDECVIGSTYSSILAA